MTRNTLSHSLPLFQASEADIEDMFNPDFYMELVNGVYGSSIGVDDLTTSHPRILRRIEEYLEDNSLLGNVNFNHYRPAHYLSENIGTLADKLSDSDLDRFQRAFDALNSLL